jgi:hypothetical protein
MWDFPPIELNLQLSHILAFIGQGFGEKTMVFRVWEIHSKTLNMPLIRVFKVFE